MEITNCFFGKNKGFWFSKPKSAIIMPKLVGNIEEKVRFPQFFCVFIGHAKPNFRNFRFFKFLRNPYFKGFIVPRENFLEFLMVSSENAFTYN